MNVEAVLGLWQDRPPEEALDTARHADDLGYRRLWIGEMATYDAFALATVVAMSTHRIEPVIGPLAVAVRTPLNIAMGIASVASLTGRTAHVALGTSSSVVVERWHGRSREGGVRRLGETAASVRALLKGERDAASGFRLRLPPVPADLHIAAFGHGAVAAAATHADRMALNMVTPAAVADFRRRLSMRPEVATWSCSPGWWPEWTRRRPTTPRSGRRSSATCRLPGMARCSPRRDMATWWSGRTQAPIPATC